jgi:hypothetical protein
MLGFFSWEHFENFLYFFKTLRILLCQGCHILIEHNFIIINGENLNFWNFWNFYLFIYFSKAGSDWDDGSRNMQW